MNKDFKIDRSKLRSSLSNSRITRGLFFDVVKKELSLQGDYNNCLFVLSDHLETEGLPSLHRLFMEMEDPTEYLFATEYFENYEHWLMVTEVPAVREVLPEWRKELELRLKAKALLAIKNVANNDLDKNQYLANKFLIEKNWAPSSSKENTKNTRGRPSKDDIKRAAYEIAQSTTDIDEDYKRITLDSNTVSSIN